MENYTLILNFDPISRDNLSQGLKIQGTVTFCLNIVIGLPLTIVIGLFEKYGGDPQKRLLTNKLLCYWILTSNFAVILNGSILILRTLYGPVGKILALVMLLDRHFMEIASPLGLVEFMAVRCLSKFSWRIATGLNENFIAAFLIIFNLTMGVLDCSVAFMMGWFSEDRFLILSGEHDSTMINAKYS